MALLRGRTVDQSSLRHPVPDAIACEKANAILASYTYPRGEVVFLDAGKHFLLPDGSQDHKIFTDGTHLTEEGYRVWAKSLAPVLDEMMQAPPIKP